MSIPNRHRGPFRFMDWGTSDRVFLALMVPFVTYQVLVEHLYAIPFWIAMSLFWWANSTYLKLELADAEKELREDDELLRRVQRFMGGRGA